MSEIAIYIYIFFLYTYYLLIIVCLFEIIKETFVVDTFLKLDMRWILLCCLALIVTRCDENDHHVRAWKAIYD